MNPHGPMAQRILSPLRLPFRHPGRVTARIFACARAPGELTLEGRASTLLPARPSGG